MRIVTNYYSQSATAKASPNAHGNSQGQWGARVAAMCFTHATTSIIMLPIAFEVWHAYPPRAKSVDRIQSNPSIS